MGYTIGSKSAVNLLIDIVNLGIISWGLMIGYTVKGL